MNIDVLLENLNLLIDKYENRLNLVNIKNKVDRIMYSDLSSPLLRDIARYRLKKILDRLLNDIEEINEMDKVLDVFDKSTYIDIDKEALIDYIDETKDKLSIIKKKLVKNKTSIVSLSLVLSFLTGGLVANSKNTPKDIVYPTRKEIYNTTTKEMDITTKYDTLYKDNECIYISQYRQYPVDNNISHTRENKLYRKYLVKDMDYQYVLINYKYIINNISKYIDNGNILLLEDIDILKDEYYFTEIYTIERIVQDQENYIYKDNHDKYLLMIAVTIFIESMIYISILGLNKELLIKSIYKNILDLINNTNIYNKYLLDIYSLEEVLYYLYNNDVLFNNKVDSIIDNYKDKSISLTKK